MFAKFSPLVLKQLIETVNAQEHIGTKIPLKVTSTGALGVCPFHEEKTPSFYVYPDHFHCFGCRAHGSIIDFDMRYHTLSFPEAVVQLAQKYNFSELLQPVDPALEKKRQESIEILRAMDGVQKLYEACLKSPLGKAARAYMESRGFSESFIQHMGLGYCPKSFESPILKALKSGLYSKALLVKTGLLKESIRDKELYDFFRERLIIPIHDEKGRVVAFGARTLPGAPPGAPKYLNSPESPVFYKSKLLFNFHRARKSIVQERTALLVEGYMDAMALMKHGFLNVVAVLGTSVTLDHLKHLAKYCDRVVFLMDSDGAGQRALVKAFELVFRSNLLEGSYCDLRGAKDPDEYLKAHGPDGLKAHLAQARPLLYAALQACCQEGYSQERQLRQVQRIVIPIILQNPSSGQQEIALRQAAQFLGLSSPNVFQPHLGGIATDTQLPSTLPEPTPTRTRDLRPRDINDGPPVLTQRSLVGPAERTFPQKTADKPSEEVRLALKSSHELKALILCQLVPMEQWPQAFLLQESRQRQDPLLQKWTMQALSGHVLEVLPLLNNGLGHAKQRMPLTLYVETGILETLPKDYKYFVNWLMQSLGPQMGLDITAFSLDNAKFVIGVLKSFHIWSPFPQSVLNRVAQDALLICNQGSASDELKRTLLHLEKQGLTVLLSQALGNSSQDLSPEELLLCKKRLQFCIQELRGAY